MLLNCGVGEDLRVPWTTKIVYPAQSGTVGGTITISGTAADDVQVTGARVQIDMNGDGFFNKTDYDALSSAGVTGLTGTSSK